MKDDNYKNLINRIEQSINQWRGLLHEAWNKRDAQGVWEAKSHIKQLETDRDKINKSHAEKLISQ